MTQRTVAASCPVSGASRGSFATPRHPQAPGVCWEGENAGKSPSVRLLAVSCSLTKSISHPRRANTEFLPHALGPC